MELNFGLSSIKQNFAWFIDIWRLHEWTDVTQIHNSLREIKFSIFLVLTMIGFHVKFLRDALDILLIKIVYIYMNVRSI